jgi:Flp pilus assembly protein TadG
MLSVRKAMGDEEGSSLVELAISLSFFLVPLVLGISAVGMLVYDSIEVSQAAHEGASYASQVYRANGSFTSTTLANVTTFAEKAAPNIPATAWTAATTPVAVTCGCLTAGSTATGQVTGTCSTGAAIACASSATPLFVTVKTQANVTPLVNMHWLGFPATVQLNGESTFELAP